MAALRTRATAAGPAADDETALGWFTATLRREKALVLVAAVATPAAAAAYSAFRGGAPGRDVVLGLALGVLLGLALALIRSSVAEALALARSRPATHDEAVAAPGDRPREQVSLRRARRSRPQTRVTR